jgi:serine protease inhibitor
MKGVIKMKRWVIQLSAVIMAAGLSAGLAGCTEEAAGTGMNIPKPEQQILDSFDVKMADASNEFGFKLFREIFEEEGNMMVSPTSLYTALSLTINGARGETQDHMAEVLGISGAQLEQFNRNNLARLYLLQEADKDVILNIANSLWMNEGEQFDPSFLERSQKYYHASARALDFGTRDSVDTINGWVKEKTDGLIEGIIEYPINPQAVLFLINAVYFQGDWNVPFDPDQTQNRLFHGSSGNRAEVPFMSNNGDFAYLEVEGRFQAVRLPYGEEERMAMYVFLPDETSSVGEFVADLSTVNWNEWRGSFASMNGRVMLPRFKVEYEKSLNEALKSMGMDIAFDEARADFFGMVSRDEGPRLFINEVRHKSFIEVDEKGTEAAAVTSVEMGVTSAPMDFFEMDVNRPFFFLIHDHDTNEVLFTGTVADPAQ